MNIFSVFLFLIILAMFAIVLRGQISVNQIERQKFLRIYLALGITFISLVWIFRDKFSTPLVFIPSFLVFGSAIPQLIARFVNLHHAKVKEKILEFRTSAPDTAAEIFGVVFMILFTLVFLIPSFVDTIDNGLNYNFPLLYAELGSIVFAIANIILFSMNVIQKTLFHSDGLSYKGLFWEWSDFQAYSWRSNPKKNNVQEILLINAKSVWIKQIKLLIPNESAEQVDSLLVLKLEKMNESA